MVYYNEFDPYAAQWLRNLIDAGHIARGEVDTRSIKDVSASDLTGFVQCHFFAGLGGWSHALRLAGWPDDRPVWTGSCPCQPFSAAGTQKGTADDRHLWPVWFNLIRECRPGVVFGEQVEAAINHGWLDLVQSDLESEGYACGAAGIPVAGVGAPHIRQRLWFVADADSGRHDGRATATGRQAGASTGIASGSTFDQLAESNGFKRRAKQEPKQPARSERGKSVRNGGTFDQLADDLDTRLQGRLPGGAHEEQQNQHGHAGRGGAIDFWSDCDWLPCRDGKSRPVESCPQPLVDGSAESLGRVRPDVIEKIEEEIDASPMESKIRSPETMRVLQQALTAQAERGWPARGLPGLCEAPFLLAFVRQLAQQGWRIAEGLSLPCEKSSPERVRVLRNGEAVAGSPCGRELEEQHAVESSDAVHFLSSLLARHAHSAWGEAYRTYAEIGSPLAVNARSRVGRLRAYGNAIVAPCAKEFIEAYLES